jgi:type VI secretion system protein ImpM
VPGAVASGFYGKLPARGDFVRAGLPRDFTDAWDGWLSGVMAASKEVAGDAWLPAFLEAPVWRFILSAGLCGARAAVGLMMPSVDRVGRYFPLTFAALLDGGAPAGTNAWLDRCEDAGRAALEQDLDPDGVTAMLGVPAPDGAGTAVIASEWWTEGSPRVQPVRMTLGSLPDAAAYIGMLGLAADNRRNEEDGRSS